MKNNLQFNNVDMLGGKNMSKKLPVYFSFVYLSNGKYPDKYEDLFDKIHNTIKDNNLLPEGVVAKDFTERMRQFSKKCPYAVPYRIKNENGESIINPDPANISADAKTEWLINYYQAHKGFNALLITDLYKVESEYELIREFSSKSIIVVIRDYYNGIFTIGNREETLDEFCYDKYITLSASDRKKNPKNKLDPRNCLLPIDECKAPKMMLKYHAEKSFLDTSDLQFIKFKDTEAPDADERMRGFKTHEDDADSEEYATSNDTLLLRGTGNVPKWEGKMELEAFEAMVTTYPYYEFMFFDNDSYLCTECGAIYICRRHRNAKDICPECGYEYHDYDTDSSGKDYNPDWVGRDDDGSLVFVDRTADTSISDNSDSDNMLDD